LFVYSKPAISNLDQISSHQPLFPPTLKKTAPNSQPYTHTPSRKTTIHISQKEPTETTFAQLEKATSVSPPPSNSASSGEKKENLQPYDDGT